jgi:hypothetical protein
MQRAHARGAAVVIVLWLLASAAGLGLLWRYKARPGDEGAPPATWPADARIVRDPDSATLVMIAHPRCTCTRASLGELAEVMRRAPGTRAYVLFVVPAGTAEWEHGELFAQARAIRGVDVIVDHDGAIASTFGVKVSGHVLVFDAAGVRRFSGGITGSRGHAGDNLGRARVIALLRGASPDADHSHVYGCALEDPT